MNDQNDGPSSPTDLHQSNHDVKFVASAGHLRDDESSRIAIIPDALNQTLPRIGSLSGGRASLEASRSMPPTAQTALEFRVIRPGAPVRRLRLTGNRYTFGSGEGCSIRLDDESLRPMHAVLLRDAHRILMRAYSVPLECNGNRVTESVLRLGDIIRMGQYRFELLAAPESSAPRYASLETRESVLHERLTQLSQQWHARHAECEVRESRCDQRESELHGRETELWSRAESLQHRESHLLAQEAAVREIQETYAATQEARRCRRRKPSCSTRVTCCVSGKRNSNDAKSNGNSVRSSMPSTPPKRSESWNKPSSRLNRPATPSVGCAMSFPPSANS